MIFQKKYFGWHVVCRFLVLKFKCKYVPKHVQEVKLNFQSNIGIGNRIFGLINAINYFSPKKINFFWDDASWVSEKFSSLFDFGYEIELNEFNGFDIFNQTTTNGVQITIEEPPCDLRSTDGTKLALEYNSIKTEHIDEIKKYFDNLKPSIQVQNRINGFELPKNCIALQIRNNKDWSDYGRNENLELFYEEINKQDKNTVFYLSAMNKEISNILKNKYPNRIIELSNKNYSSMIDAVSDLYLLGKCKSAIYSYGSTFSELAWWLGGASQIVSIIGNDTNWKDIK